MQAIPTTAPPGGPDAWLQARRADIERTLEAHVALDGDDPGRLVEAMRYSLLAPGKRLRPLLALAAAETQLAADDASWANVLLACCAVELVHCYSLIHDDLPSMDDDDFRRGRPSNHKAFDEATAILAGDALLTLAFDWLAQAGEAAGRPGPYLSATRALARGAGMQGMVRGQARDLREAPPADVATLERLHAEKTGALFRAAIEIGANVAGAKPDELAALVAFGERFGVAFQHADDLDDADHPAHAAAARVRLEALVGDAVKCLAPLGTRGDLLATFARRLLPLTAA